MEPESLHELAAGYALDALDDDERVAFEQHLAECEQCAADVLAFRETAALLAYAAEGPEPPAPSSVSACSRRQGASCRTRASSCSARGGRCG